MRTATVILALLLLTGCYQPVITYQDQYQQGGCWTITKDSCYQWKDPENAKIF